MTIHRYALSALCAFVLIPLLHAQGGPPGALVNDLAIAADDPNVMFAATPGGVYTSNTAGETWVAQNEGLPRLDIPRVAGIDSLLYAALGEDGVYRSTDGGSWGPVTNQLAGFDVLSVETDPTNPEIVFAGTANGSIYKSLNRGDAWTSVSAGLADGAYFEISASPNDPELLFAGNVAADGSLGRLFRTTNGGTSWAEAISGPALFRGVGFSRSAHGTAWVASTAGLFLTEDSGATFTGPIFSTLQFQDVAVDPVDSQIVYAGTQGSGVVKSIDGGIGWDLTGSGLPRAVVQRVLITGETLFAGLGGSGVYRSPDGGESWTISSAGMRSADVLAVIVNHGDSSDVLASTTGGGLFRSRTGGSLWGESRSGVNSFQVSSMRRDPQNPETIYAGTTNPLSETDGSFLKSTDGGSTWELEATGAAVFAVAAHPDDGRTVYLGSLTDCFIGNSGLIRSTDRGETLETIFGDNSELAFKDVFDIEVNPENPRNLLILVRDPCSRPPFYQVARTTDEGRIWLGAGVTTTPYTDVTIDPANPDRVLLGSLAGLFLSTDGGATFAPATTGLPDDVSVFSIAIDGNDSSAAYASTSAGVFKSTSDTPSWSPLDSGLDGVQVREIFPDPSQGGVLYAATTANGLYKSTDAGATWQPTGGIPATGSKSIVNAFTFHNGTVSPGEIVSVFGQNIGPAEGVSAAFDPETGKLPTELAGVKVFFNDVPAALIFVRSDQLNLQVPYEVARLENVRVRIEFQGGIGSALTLNVSATHPGVWGGAVNQDNTINSEQNPAAENSFVQLFATGAGTVTPAMMTGAPAPASPPFVLPDAEVRVLVNGQPAPVAFAGLAPGFAGLLQINLRLPPGLTGRLELEVFMGDSASPVKAVVYVT